MLTMSSMNHYHEPISPTNSSHVNIFYQCARDVGDVTPSPRMTAPFVTMLRWASQPEKASLHSHSCPRLHPPAVATHTPSTTSQTEPSRSHLAKPPLVSVSPPACPSGPQSAPASIAQESSRTRPRSAAQLPHVAPITPAQDRPQPTGVRDRISSHANEPAQRGQHRRSMHQTRATQLQPDTTQSIPQMLTSKPWMGLEASKLSSHVPIATFALLLQKVAKSLHKNSSGEGSSSTPSHSCLTHPKVERESSQKGCHFLFTGGVIRLKEGDVLDINHTCLFKNVRFQGMGEGAVISANSDASSTFINCWFENLTIAVTAAICTFQSCTMLSVVANNQGTQRKTAGAQKARPDAPASSLAQKERAYVVVSGSDARAFLWRCHIDIACVAKDERHLRYSMALGARAGGFIEVCGGSITYATLQLHALTDRSTGVSIHGCKVIRTGTQGSSLPTGDTATSSSTSGEGRNFL